MAAIGAVGGLIVHLLTDDHSYATPFPVWKQAATSFTVIATISFLLTVELRRWTWAVAFALGWGAVIALVGWFTAQYNQHPRNLRIPLPVGDPRGADRRALVPDRSATRAPGASPMPGCTATPGPTR